MAEAGRSLWCFSHPSFPETGHKTHMREVPGGKRASLSLMTKEARRSWTKRAKFPTLSSYPLPYHIPPQPCILHQTCNVQKCSGLTISLGFHFLWRVLCHVKLTLNTVACFPPVNLSLHLVFKPKQELQEGWRKTFPSPTSVELNQKFKHPRLQHPTTPTYTQRKRKRRGKDENGEWDLLR